MATPPLVKRDYTPILVTAAVFLVALIVPLSIHLSMIREREPPYVQLEVATRLTTRRSAILSPAQIRGESPLTTGGLRPIGIRDVRLSLRHDIDALHVVGMCAMHYDFGVSACILRRLGPDEYVEMYNLNVTGWRAEKLINWETSTLCGDGRQKYQVERFNGVWIRYMGTDGRVYDRWFEDPEARALQHLAQLNRGTLPCNLVGIEEMAIILREAAMMRDAPNSV